MQTNDYLSKLSKAERARLLWYSKNGPKPRVLSEIPDDPRSFASWNHLPFFSDTEKVFPPYKHHLFAAKKFGVSPVPRFSPGIPYSISPLFFEFFPPGSFFNVYTCLYECSYYKKDWKMRICEVSYGLLHSKTGLSHKTIYRTFDFLRSKWFVRLIWRGRPKPDAPRYLHSCYELPFNRDHIISWRVHNGRKRK